MYNKGIRLDANLAFLKSLVVYRLNPIRRIQSYRHYGHFIGPGDLCFDIGAHAGDRISTFLSLGASVVAIEPLPDFMKFLNQLYGKNKRVVLVEAAVTSQNGNQSFFVSTKTPAMSTLNHWWTVSIARQDRFSKVVWNKKIEVKTLILDTLIRKYGSPKFCKIDVAGAEFDVLAGLTEPLANLSFEYIPAHIDIALSCIERLSSLGTYRFNISVGERKKFIFEKWENDYFIRDTLQRTAPNDPSGDVYAMLQL